MKKKLVKKHLYGNKISSIDPTKGTVKRLGDTVLWYPESGGDPIAFTVDEWNEEVKAYNIQQQSMAEVTSEAMEEYYKKHPEERGKIRHGEFTYQPLPAKEQWGTTKKIKEATTGKDLLPGDYVLARNGKMVRSESEDWLDWLAENNQVLPGLELPEITVHLNKKSKYQYNTIGLDYDDYAASRLNAPIATTLLWEQIKLLEDLERFGLTPEGHRIWLNRRDEEAREKTPGAGALFAAPLLLGVGAATFMYNPMAFPASLLGAEVGAKTVDYPFQKQGYKSFGDWMYQGTNAPLWLKDNSNLGLWLGGGFGWNVGKNLERSIGINLMKKPTLLADTYADRWALENAQRLASLRFLNNYYAKMPQQVEDVVAEEITSNVPEPIRIQRPGVFFAKTGEVNRGSITGAAKGNWLIKSLLPGNALEKRVAADGTISWNDFNWYLQQRTVSPYDRSHMLLAVKDLPKDKPISYNELTAHSEQLIPKFTSTPSNNLKGYGLDDLGYGHDSGEREHYGYVRRIDPDEGVNAESIVFNSPIGSYDGRYTSKMVHFPDATQHMRGFTLDSESDVYYVTEMQSDFFQLGMKHNDFAPGSIEEHMAETTQLRGIQEAMLHAAALGKSVVRFPTPETVIKIQYYAPELTPEGSRLSYAERSLLRAALNDFVNAEYPEAHQLLIKEIEAETEFDDADKLVKEYWREVHPEEPEEPNAMRFWLIKPADKLRAATLSELELALIDSEFRNILAKKEQALEKYKEIDRARLLVLNQAHQDPRYIQIKTEGELRVNQIIQQNTIISKGRQNILNKYKAFPKHFRRIYGDKPQIRNVVDSQGNTWFEVDIPKDINTRSLTFSTVGDINEGSATGNFDLKNFLDRLYKAKRTVEEYLGSKEHVKLIMKSGVSKKEALTIANEMKNNALQVKHRFSTQSGMDSSYGRRPKDNGKISPSIKIGKDTPDVESTIYHEYGGHAATLGLLQHNLEGKATANLGENNFLGKYWGNILRLSPNLLKINKHNLSLKPIRLPKYLVPNSELSENDKFWLDYLEDVDEYSTRARAANIGKNNHNAETGFSEVLGWYFTPESIENLRNLVWGKAGELNKGSITGGTTKEGLNNFILNDIIPRLKKSGHTNIPENFTYKVRQYDPEHDVFDALLSQRNLKGLAFNSLVTNDVTINGPFESQDFGLMAHEIGNHNLRYNLQSDYKPVPRYYLNKYLSHDIDEETLNILLNSHPGIAVILPLEKEILSDAYSFVETFAKLHPENKTKVLEELSAINTLFRAQLSLNGRITGDELNTIIDNTTDGYILNDLKELMYTLAGIILKIEEITGIPENKIVFMSELELDSLTKQYPELQQICLKVREAMKKVGVFTPPLIPFLNKKDQAN